MHKNKLKLWKLSLNRNILISLIFIISIALDQITKYIAVTRIMYSPPEYYLGGLFVIKYAENSGAMLGFGSNLPENVRFWFLTVFVGFMLLALLGYLFFSKSLTKQQTVGLALIAGGGISNFIDRALNDGKVVDFMHMDSGFGWLKTGIFNFADVSIMLGLAVMIIWGDWRTKEVEKEKKIEDTNTPIIDTQENESKL